MRDVEPTVETGKPTLVRNGFRSTLADQLAADQLIEVTLDPPLPSATDTTVKGPEQ